VDGPVIFVPITLFIATAVVLAPLARAFAKRIEGRGTAQHIPSEVTDRLERMEQAIDSIAIEVERISEGQRFTTRLLSEATAAGTLPSGPRQP
jgi:hypothetical protein